MHDANPGASGAPRPNAEAPYIEPYRILDRLGEGGMGTVYLAEQSKPVKRRVALKVIKLGMDSKAVVARFEQERQALAMMDHEGIAKVYDCGTTDRGQPFFAMEYVKGVPLDRYCDDQKISLRDRLLLMRQVCAAVQHAHHKGVVHRDLKPGNVLVSDDGGKRSVKVIDFGLAKAMGAKLVEATLFTEAGQIVGTPEYMAPEQADPTNLNIDTRADVYSLGVMLYQLLCGDLPFSGAELRAAGMLEVQRILREVEPAKPSTRITKLGAGAAPLAEARRVSLSALKKALVGDLDWVVLKALEKDRNRRYETANALSSDIQRYLDDEPLVAGPPSAAYRLRKLVRRYRVPLVTATLVVLTAIVGAASALHFAARANQQAEENSILARSEARAREEATRLAAAESAAKEAATKLAEENGRTVDNFNQLAGLVRLKDALARQDALWPAWPEQAEALAAWLEGDCAQLLAMRLRLTGTLADLRSRTTSPDLSRDARTTNGEADQAIQSEQFLFDTLSRLLADLESMERNQKPDVEQRLLWARQVRTASLAHPKARVTWAEALSAIRRADGEGASTLYRGHDVDLSEGSLMGLVPIGMNPVTRLWEFYDLRSAWDGRQPLSDIDIPAHDPDGSLEVQDTTGIVFVLLPGGIVTVGSQDQEPEAPFYDPRRQKDEGLHQVALAPFLIARHELTQGQWQRLWTWDSTLRNPSNYRNNANPLWRRPVLRNPVEMVDWHMVTTLLSRHGMMVPSEAQWEYAARAGTTTPWTVAYEDLRHYANVADATARRSAPQWGAFDEWSDGHVVHAPVGSFRANAFGLFDVQGNVAEWCRDQYANYGGEEGQDGARQDTADPATPRVNRGGGFSTPAATARLAIRDLTAPSSRDHSIGIRPARRLVR